jgi:hypothetical protein
VGLPQEKDFCDELRMGAGLAATAGLGFGGLGRCCRSRSAGSPRYGCGEVDAEGSHGAVGGRISSQAVA